jgi:cysteinyl-tRNA synthetase
MNDDFNTPILIATLFEGVKIINSAADGRIELGEKQISDLKELYARFMRDVLGLMDEGASGVSENNEGVTSGLLDLLVELRNDAKSNKDWANADRIRNTLSDLGVTVTDGKDGSTWSHD